MSNTHLRYKGTALPVTDEVVVLFNSALAFPPGGCFHLLGQHWYQYAIFLNSAGSATGTVSGQYSDDKGVSWNTFYTSGAIAKNTEESDEVYVGTFKDVRFILTIGTADLNALRVNQTLCCDKPTSKTSNADVLHNDTAAGAALPT